MTWSSLKNKFFFTGIIFIITNISFVGSGSFLRVTMKCACFHVDFNCLFLLLFFVVELMRKGFLTWRCLVYISGIYYLSCKQDHSSSSMIVTCIYRAWKTWVTMNQEMMNVVPVVLYNGVTDSLISSWSIRTQHCMHSMTVAPLTIVFNHLALVGQIDHRI